MQGWICRNAEQLTSADTVFYAVRDLKGTFSWLPEPIPFTTQIMYTGGTGDWSHGPLRLPTKRNVRRKKLVRLTLSPITLVHFRASNGACPILLWLTESLSLTRLQLGFSEPSQPWVSVSIFAKSSFSSNPSRSPLISDHPQYVIKFLIPHLPRGSHQPAFSKNPVVGLASLPTLDDSF